MTEAERIVGKERPAWWRCVASADPRFTAGVAYEVLEYDNDGQAIIITDDERKVAKLPVEKADFVPHDPWATYRRRLLQEQANARDSEQLVETMAKKLADCHLLVSDGHYNEAARALLGDREG